MANERMKELESMNNRVYITRKVKKKKKSTSETSRQKIRWEATRGIKLWNSSLMLRAVYISE